MEKEHATQLGWPTRGPRVGGRPPMVRTAFVGGAESSTGKHAEGQSIAFSAHRSAGANIAREANIERMKGRKHAWAYQSPSS